MTFEDILAVHTARYPHMGPQDYGKLAYQSHFGPEHMISGPEQVEEGIRREWRTLEEASTPAGPEKIGGGLCRFPLSVLNGEGDAALLARLFAATAREHKAGAEGFGDKLEELEKLQVSGMAQWLAEYRAAGCPPVRHSEGFRQAYHPHYRLVKWEYARYFPVLREVTDLLQEDRPVILAIDGRCGSGKSSLGRALQEVFSCTLVHMDDYHVAVEDRPDNWLEVPAANMDLERFRTEVLQPARRGQEICYRPFRCQSGAFLEEQRLPHRKLTVVEGSYSHHPDLAEYYDRKFFLTCESQVQLQRLREREGDYFPRFLELWLPLEERYFRAFDVEQQADLVVDTGEEITICMKKSNRR